MWWLLCLASSAVFYNTTCDRPLVIPSELNEEGLRFYWYNLPGEYNVGVMAYWNEKSRRHGYGCDVGCRVCDERRWGGRGVDMAVRQMGAGVAVLAKLSELGRVEDPAEADYFVVPALTHLLWNSGWHWLIGTNNSRITSLFAHLTHLNPKTASRHIFIGGDEPSLHPLIRVQPLVLHLGPRLPTPYTTPKGTCYPGRPDHIILPDPQLTPFTQTTAYKFNPNRPNWMFYFGALADHLPARNRAVNELLELQKTEKRGDIQIHLIMPVKQGTRVFSRHYALHKNKKVLRPHEVRGYYNNSQYCLVMSGDIPHQTRFFEAVLHGCLPVVVEYRKGSRRSWWRHWARPNESSMFSGFDPAYPGDMEDSYPFTDYIPYDDFTVVIPHEYFAKHGLVSYLHTKITPEDYTRKLNALHRHRTSLLYDLTSQSDVTRLVIRKLAAIKKSGYARIIPCPHSTAPHAASHITILLLTVTFIIAIYAMSKLHQATTSKRRASLVKQSIIGPNGKPVP